MKKHSIAAALAGLMFVGASHVATAQEQASFATLTKADGKVMVDKGTGFTSATTNTVLKNGDRVITLGGSTAEITFGDGCRAQLIENNMMVISAEQGCKAAIAKVTPTGAGATASSGTPTRQILGPLLVAGTAAVLIANWDDSTPISGQ